MVRGWRNDPRWVEFYKRRDEDRVQREIERIKFEVRINESLSRCNAAIRRMQKAPLFYGEGKS